MLRRSSSKGKAPLWRQALDAASARKSESTRSSGGSRRDGRPAQLERRVSEKIASCAAVFEKKDSQARIARLEEIDAQLSMKRKRSIPVRNKASPPSSPGKVVLQRTKTYEDIAEAEAKAKAAEKEAEAWLRKHSHANTPLPKNCSFSSRLSRQLSWGVRRNSSSKLFTQTCRGADVMNVGATPAQSAVLVF